MSRKFKHTKKYRDTRNKIIDPKITHSKMVERLVCVERIEVLNRGHYINIIDYIVSIKIKVKNWFQQSWKSYRRRC